MKNKRMVRDYGEDDDEKGIQEFIPMGTRRAGIRRNSIQIDRK
jgi:hypothetical protein